MKKFNSAREFGEKVGIFPAPLTSTPGQLGAGVAGTSAASMAANFNSPLGPLAKPKLPPKPYVHPVPYGQNIFERVDEDNAFQQSHPIAANSYAASDNAFNQLRKTWNPLYLGPAVGHSFIGGIQREGETIGNAYGNVRNFFRANSTGPNMLQMHSAPAMQKANAAREFGEKVALTIPGLDFNNPAVAAGVPMAGLGALAGGLYGGLSDPGEDEIVDENGKVIRKPRSRLMNALQGALGGATTLGLGGAAAGYFAPEKTRQFGEYVRGLLPNFQTAKPEAGKSEFGELGKLPVKPAVPTAPAGKASPAAGDAHLPQTKRVSGLV